MGLTISLWNVYNSLRSSEESEEQKKCCIVKDLNWVLNLQYYKRTTYTRPEPGNRVRVRVDSKASLSRSGVADAPSTDITTTGYLTCSPPTVVTSA
ncbi:hypothetical protein J6590_061206 [Homalodisca vitripennis]|nr:hypothetical protein J6590_061206 [Homalodisca vitripennis]